MSTPKRRIGGCVQRRSSDRPRLRPGGRMRRGLGGGDTLRLAVLTRAGGAQWLDAYQSTRSSTEDHYRLEASYWVGPLPRDGLVSLVCAWPEIGLSEVLTDVVLADLAARADQTRSMWDAAEDR